MKISTEKRDFLKRISNGLADEIDVFIKNNLLDGSSFSEEKFDALMDTTLEELLQFFDDRDMGLHNAYQERCIPCDDLFSAGVELGELY